MRAAGIEVTKVMMNSTPVTNDVFLVESIGTPFGSVVWLVIAVGSPSWIDGSSELAGMAGLHLGDREQGQAEVAQRPEQSVQCRLVDVTGPTGNAPGGAES